MVSLDYRASSAQVAAYARRSQTTTQSVDGAKVAGGTVGQIPLAQAAFDPPPPQQGQQGGAAPPPTQSGAPPATSGTPMGKFRY